MLETPKTTIKTDEHAADTTAIIVNEITSRTKFTKLFAMSDGSFTSVNYSMLTHMKKNGNKENMFINVYRMNILLSIGLGSYWYSVNLKISNKNKWKAEENYNGLNEKVQYKK